MANNVLVWQDQGQFAVIATTEAGGVHTLNVTVAAPNSSIKLTMPNGQPVLLATVLAGGVHTLCVAT